VPARLVYADRTDPHAIARIIARSDRQRIARAVTSGLASWGLALVSLFIPLGHFILVPSFLIAGPVLFVLRMAEGVTLAGAEGVCPMCGTRQEFHESGRLLARHPVRCAACRRQLELLVDVPGVTRADAPVARVAPTVWTAGSESPGRENPGRAAGDVSD
jgi:hypothetical protein